MCAKMTLTYIRKCRGDPWTKLSPNDRAYYKNAQKIMACTLKRMQAISPHLHATSESAKLCEIKTFQFSTILFQNRKRSNQRTLLDHKRRVQLIKLIN